MNNNLAASLLVMLQVYVLSSSYKLVRAVSFVGIKWYTTISWNFRLANQANKLGWQTQIARKVLQACPFRDTCRGYHCSDCNCREQAAMFLIVVHLTANLDMAALGCHICFGLCPWFGWVVLSNIVHSTRHDDSGYRGSLCIRHLSQWPTVDL